MSLTQDSGRAPDPLDRHAITKLIAFYLPQFHPIPENDSWWGKGFTEWHNVTRARPQFPEHYQPRLPADLGFYDLRLPETRQAQADLAREYGIHGFCYYHYWFNGMQILQRPFNDVLASGEPDFPFCLCWANENWTRAWDGRSGENLLQQNYSEEDDRAHIRSLIPAFADRRYIRIGAKPLFIIYRAGRLPDPLRTTAIWREEARAAGLGDLFLCKVESFPDEHTEPTRSGFDACIEFQPDWMHMGDPLSRSLIPRVTRKLKRLLKTGDHANVIYDYATVAARMIEKETPPYKRFSCVTPSWDNSARRRRGGVILKNSTPDLYEHWLGATLRKSRDLGHELVFINAWNEWAEGAHLEPCQKWGHAYLQATQRALTANVHATARSAVPLKQLTPAYERRV